MPEMPPRPQIIPAHDCRRLRWRNDAGWTREIHAEPSSDPGAAASASAWDWRLSIAEIEHDAAFSRFDGIERELVLLSGNGLRLRFAGEGDHVVTLDPPYARHRFAGEATVRGELVDGRTEDFNLMWRRDAVDAALWHRPLVGSMLVFVDPGSVWIVHVLAGQARLTGAGAEDLPVLTRGDTACLRAADTRARHALEGGGEVLLIRIAPRA
jgi:environmental stress-induced protein Ves